MPTTSIRTAVKTRLVDLLTDALNPVQVSYGWPGQDLQDESVFCGQTTGQVTVADFRAGRKTRDDTFTVEVFFLAMKPGQTAAQAEERAEELYGSLETALAENPKLGDLPGVIHVAQLGNEVEIKSAPSTEGWEAEVRAVITVKTRVS
jgi:hypothetical protein